MVQVVGRDFDIIDIESAFHEVVITNSGTKLIRCYRKIGVLHLARERFAQRLVEPPRTVDIPLGSGNKERGNERNPLNMIPVRVADQDVTPQTFHPSCYQRLAEGMRTGSTIDNDECPTRGAHFNARGVSTIADSGRPRLGNRPTRAPKLDVHGASRSRASTERSSVMLRVF